MDTTTATSRQPIPLFALYGEDLERGLPELLHIEDIAVRSEAHDWHIKPHRHGSLFQLLLMLDGRMQLTLEQNQRVLSGCWAICLPPGCVHGFKFQAGTRGLVLSLEQSLLKLDANNPAQSLLATLGERPCVFAPEESPVLLAQLTELLQLARDELRRTDTGYRQMLDWLAKLILLNLARQINDQHIDTTASTDLALLRRFRESLENHFQQQWRVQDYARALNLSAPTLNRLCRRTTGRSAKTLIQDRSITEARRLLIYTRKNIEEIAYALGYEDPAYFSRVFRRATAQAPSQYRRTAISQRGGSTGPAGIDR